MYPTKICSMYHSKHVKQIPHHKWDLGNGHNSKICNNCLNVSSRLCQRAKFLLAYAGETYCGPFG